MIDTSKNKTRFFDYLKQIGAFAFCIALFIGGMTFESRQQSPVISNLQIELQKVKDDSSRNEKELQTVKTEYSQFRQQNSDSGSGTASKDINTKNPSSFDKVATAPSTSNSPSTNVSEQLVELESDKTAILFNGGLRISLVGISFEGDPLRHKVTAIVQGLTKSEKFEKADVGELVVIKEGQTTYEIRVHSAGTFSAIFSITAKKS